MSFWDTYEAPVGSYIVAAEKQVMAENGIPFKVNGVLYEASDRFEGKPRYILEITSPNPETGEDEERLLAFPAGSGADSRDRMLAEMRTYFEGDGAEPVVAKVEKKGRAFFLTQA